MKIKDEYIYHYSVNVVATITSFVIYCIHPAFLIPALALGLSIGNLRGRSHIRETDWYTLVADLYGILTVTALTMFSMSIWRLV